ncbi:PIN domain-containing protein [uncultured Sunxiuqinia sp.]|uniref:PIN domain-containing protein n=1 Tax=uncultured Sunxiuqinia sp. TaxID=1573825 RepID=UPI0026197CB3|nr:PIN domain-containing protein [uncultured Sunxiuqinia sp.]
MDKEHIFIHHSIYPNAADIFNIELLPFENIKDDCIYVLDTNALLIPYSTSSAGFDEIKKTFTKLIKNNKLLIPGQVAREFAKNRPEKIKTLFQQLSRIRNKVEKPTTGQYPLLEKLDEYNEAVTLEEEVTEVQKKYSKKIGEILDKIKEWRWNDPISQVYNQLFSPDTIFELEIDKEAIAKELERRNKYSIPPGFQDKNKPDEGIGDLLIWLSILEISIEKNKHIVFVSGDEKNDWFHRSENQSLYPRFELLTEFKTKTDNKSFHIIKLSQLLTSFEADESAVKEVEIKERTSTVFWGDYRVFIRKAEELVTKWLVDTEPQSEIIRNNGYPNLILKDNEKTEGIKILVVRSGRSFQLLPRFTEQFHKAYYDVSSGRFNCFRLIIVGMSSDFSSEYIDDIITRQSNKYKNEFIRITIGLINDIGEFEMLNSYP